MSRSSRNATHTANFPLGRGAARAYHRRRRLQTLRNASLGFVTAVGIVVVVCYAVGFFTPWGNAARTVLAETIVSTRHDYLAKVITTPKEYKELYQELHPAVKNVSVPAIATASGQTSTSQGGAPGAAANITVKPISGSSYNGYVMLVKDPLTVRLVAAKVVAGKGEYITDMASRVGAVAGTNASGFVDPNGSGWGAQVYGLEMVGGKVLSPPLARYGMVSVGFTDKGQLLMGDYSTAQMQQLGVKDAVQFYPELVVDGKPMITQGDGGWGYGPRTAIGQKKDGTVIFVVTNGRFHGGSGMGASQRDVMNVMLQYGAWNACAMDGGSSSVIYNAGKILNSPSTVDPNGQRHLPDAWLVFPNEAQASNYNPGT